MGWGGVGDGVGIAAALSGAGVVFTPPPAPTRALWASKTDRYSLKKKINTKTIK